MRSAVGFKTLSIEPSDPRKKVDFFNEMRGSDCSIEQVGIGKAPFRLRKNARFWSPIGNRPFRSTDPTA